MAHMIGLVDKNIKTVIIIILHMFRKLEEGLNVRANQTSRD